MKGLLYICIIGITMLSSCKEKATKEETIQKDTPGQVNTVTTENGKTPVVGSKENTNPYYKSSLVSLRGYIKGGAGLNVILDELEIGQINPLISSIVEEDGSFGFNVFIPEPGIYQLRFPNGNIHLFLRGGNVQINTNISDLGAYEVIGSPESVQLKEMYIILSDLNHKTSSLQDRVELLKKDKKKVKQLLALVDSLPIYYAKINAEKSEKLKKFITRLDTSMIALLASFYLDADVNYDFIMSIKAKFEKKSSHSKFYKQLDDKMVQIIPVGPGKMAPNTVVDDVNGKSTSLSALKGKTVLIYFWASFSDPCRSENKTLKVIYDKYKSKGFEVFAISIDESDGKRAWQDAIKSDELTWINVSNLLGWNDELTAIYKIEDIPYLILLDQTGKIISRGFRAVELELKLKQLGL